MTPWKAAKISDPVDLIDTPALILDLDAFERNLDRMQQALAGTSVRLRPHAKSHKCPQIALRQIQIGAVGICCQKVSEAASFVDHGIHDILITNQVVGSTKLHHLMTLARRAKIGVLVDHVEQVQALAQSAMTYGASLNVYVEVDVGAGRCGVAPGEQAARLAMAIQGADGLNFAGLQCYHGSAQHLRTPNERAQAVNAAVAAAIQSRQAIESLGMKVPVITGAGTGSFVHERDSGVFGEIQAGSYIFMDRDYADNQRGSDDPMFEHALFVLTSVMSINQPGKVVVDAGLKASSVDSGMPVVWQKPGYRYLKASDEHGLIGLPQGESVPLGHPLWLIPGHCDPTVNLYDDLICIRHGKVEAVWPIAARGAVL